MITIFALISTGQFQPMALWLLIPKEARIFELQFSFLTSFILVRILCSIEQI